MIDNPAQVCRDALRAESQSVAHCRNDNNIRGLILEKPQISLETPKKHMSWHFVMYLYLWLGAIESSMSKPRLAVRQTELRHQLAICLCHTQRGNFDGLLQ